MRRSLVTAVATACALAGAAAPASAEAPRLWGSPYGQQYMLQCLKEGGAVSRSPSGALTCCSGGLCITCDGAENCQVSGSVLPDGIAGALSTQAPSDTQEPAPAPRFELQR